ncbi:MAG TPA: hypothetical protein VGK67_01980 [Myxococcales bacterium]|jgi:hypothetical protein
MRRPFLAAVLLCAALGAGCAHDTSVDARVAGAQQLVREAEDRLRAANDLIKADRDLDKAGKLVAEARELTQEPQMLYYADRENLEDRISQAGARLTAARDARHRREIAARVPERKERATALLAEFRTAADLLQDRAALDRKRTAKARETLDEGLRFLNDSKEFEVDAGWASFSSVGRKELLGRTVQVVLAESLMSFLDGPVAQNAKAKKLFDESKAAKGEEKAALLTQARDAWLACGKDAAALVAQTPALEREPLQVPGAKTTAKSFAAACEAQAKSVEGLLKAPAKGAAPAKPPPAKSTPPPAKKK